jgi:hypothetical protein
LSFRLFKPLAARRGQRVAPPAHVGRALEQLFGDRVYDVIVIERSLFARLHAGARATTRRRHIYLRGTGTEFFANPALMLHEYCHVLLQWEPGALTTWRYVLEWCRRGYYANRFEVEARAFAALHLRAFDAALAAAREAARDRHVIDML